MDFINDDGKLITLQYELKRQTIIQQAPN